MDDRKIIDLYFARSEDAVTETKAKYGRYCYSIAYGILGCPEDAEECENDTYLQAWNSIPPHQPRNYLYAFLLRIIRHISIDRCRHQDRLCRKAYMQELSDELLCCVPGNADVESQIDAMVLGKCISDFLKTQPALNRNVFIRRYWYLDSLDVICKQYRISQSKAKSMLFRSRNALRIYLRKEGYTL